ncbi:cell envelope-like function transcriptional attenuator common domain protein [Abiotrophia defectiva ATCC 49176]|uniref:Cell envelope-like function transcriptional attenuator common domain protein n=2 Tax=Abiotrophia defectiva TaxID=46125 RepID=W1Q549_ABIDE|nr:cell envelope-like function transcriptional attenuator common domain protein [Abiotrophia defectiva ATCC 49176]
MVASGLVAYFLLTYKILAGRGYQFWVLGGLGAVLLLLILLNGLKRLGKTTLVLATIVILGASYGAYQMNATVNFFNKLNTNTQKQELTMSLATLAEGGVADVAALDGKVVLAPLGQDRDNVQALVDDLKAKRQVTVTVQEVPSYLAAYQQLLDGKAQAMVLNSGYESLLEGMANDFSSKIKKLYQYNHVTEVADQPAKPEPSNQQTSQTPAENQPFNLYISGIDTFGPVSSVSRSDVNVIATINPKTHQILLTTTPRDAYVPIADGGADQKDKLTHAGIYGVEASMHTLARLYDTPIDYYVRLNFTSFLNIIDTVGGIDVYNDQAFTSLYGKYDFPVGELHLNADQALGFVRERYSLSGGDNDRGKNHEKVITALIKKLGSRQTLLQAQEVMDRMSQSVQTNLPLTKAMELVNEQLESGQAYTVTSVALTGHGSTGLPSYAMPGAELYMMQVDEASLAERQAQIKQVLGQ